MVCIFFSVIDDLFVLECELLRILKEEIVFIVCICCVIDVMFINLVCCFR